MGRSNVVIKFTKPGAPTLADLCTVFINIGVGKFMFLSNELVIRYKLEGNVLRNLRPAMLQMLMGKDIQISMISKYP